MNNCVCNRGGLHVHATLVRAGTLLLVAGFKESL